MNADRPSYFKHESSYVDEPSDIGEGTKIWHFCHIQSGAVIGSHCVLGQNVNVAGNVRIGNRVKIQNNVSVYEGVTIEDDVFCGPSMVFTNVKVPRSEYPVGGRYTATLIRCGATLGANCTVLCGTVVGRYAFVSAGSVVTKDVPDHALVMGVPAKFCYWISRAGERLVFAPDGIARCPRSGIEYRFDGAAAREV